MNELVFDECFMFIYRSLENLKDSLIIASFLKQIEVPLDEIMQVYEVTNDYVNKLIGEQVPRLRVLAYKRLEELPNMKVLFFPEFKPNFEPLYKEFIDRIDYIFEIRRNTNKLLVENSIYVQLISNSAFLFLLNHLSVKDALIMGESLDIIDFDEDKLMQIYNYDYEYFENTFYQNISLIRNNLVERITKLENIEMETSYFDYEDLCKQYEDLLERIDDTKEYLSGNPKR